MSGLRINEIDAIGVESPVETPFGYSQGWVTRRSATLVRIEASDGTTGWGECWGPTAGTEEIVSEFLGPRLKGEDPLDVERHYGDLYTTSRAAYQSIVPLPAISGIDIALHDLKGKLLDEPVSALLGDRRRSTIRAYTTGHYFKKGADLAEQYDLIAEEAASNAQRLNAVKIKLGLELLGYGPPEDLRLIERVRETLGNGPELMVDANYAYDGETALVIGDELDRFDVCWFEEPVPPERFEDYVRLRETLNVDVAGGECHAPYELFRLIDEGGLDIVQPDVCNVGGLTPAIRIADHAAKHGVAVVPHVWGTPVAIAASLQYLSVLPGDPYLEFDLSPNPLREDLADPAFEISRDGCVQIPEEPGLGVNLDHDAIDRYRVTGH